MTEVAKQCSTVFVPTEELVGVAGLTATPPYRSYGPETNVSEEFMAELSTGPTCGPHDLEVVPDVRITQVYCRGCGGVLDLSRAKRLEED